jgi:hypothetical protein
MTASTPLEALVAEMLGDIGKLHDAVNTLKDVLPSQTDEVEQRLIGIIGLLQKAGDVYRGQIETYTNDQGELIRTQMENDAQKARQHFERDSNKAINTALSSVEHTVKNTVQTEIVAPIRTVLHALRQSAWKNIALCFGSSLIGGLIVLGGVLLIHNPNQEGLANLGRAVSLSWDKLDKNTRAIINGARTQ